MKYKHFNKFNCFESLNQGGELNTSPSLVDKDLVIPTLQEYVEMYLMTGRAPLVDNGQELVDDNPDADFDVVDMRNPDIDDLKEYSDYLNSEIERIKLKRNQSGEIEENFEFSIKDEERKKEEKKDDVKDKV